MRVKFTHWVNMHSNIWHSECLSDCGVLKYDEPLYSGGMHQDPV